MASDLISMAKVSLGPDIQMAELGKKNFPTEEAKMKEAAEQFEAVFLQQMVDSMWKSLPNEGLLSGSNEEALYRDMFNQALSEEMAKSQSFGIKDVILQEMEKSKAK